MKITHEWDISNPADKADYEQQTKTRTKNQKKLNAVYEIIFLREDIANLHNIRILQNLINKAWERIEKE